MFLTMLAIEILAFLVRVLINSESLCASSNVMTFKITKA